MTKIKKNVSKSSLRIKRNVMGNPTLLDSSLTADNEFVTQLKQNLKICLSDIISPPPINSKDFFEANKDSLCQLSKKERRERYTSFKADARSKRIHDTELLSHLSIGLRKCLRDLKNDRLCFFLYDSSLDLQIIMSVFNRESSLPIVPLSGLSSLCKEMFGFPCGSLGFNRSIAQNCPRFSEIFKLSRSLISSSDVEVDDDNSNEIQPPQEVKSTDENFIYVYRDVDCTDRLYVPKGDLTSPVFSSPVTIKSVECPNFISLGLTNNQNKYQDGEVIGKKRKVLKQRLKPAKFLRK